MNYSTNLTREKTKIQLTTKKFSAKKPRKKQDFSQKSSNNSNKNNCLKKFHADVTSSKKLEYVMLPFPIKLRKT